MINLLGFYDYTVILTEVSLLCAVIGISHAIGENYRVSMVCLILCGICDAFDGHIARTKKNRSKEEKHFGIQLDSLCDLICFGILPGIICYQNGVNVILVGLYCLAAVIRLAWFNVLEWNRQQCDEGHSSAYHGLPVTSISGILPLILKSATDINAPASFHVSLIFTDRISAAAPIPRRQKKVNKR